MDEFSGRTVLETNNIVELPLMVFPTVVLVPGQTLPLHLFHPQVRFFFLAFQFPFHLILINVHPSISHL